MKSRSGRKLCKAASSAKDGARRPHVTRPACAGSARRSFDYGRLRVAYFAETGAYVDPGLAARMASWGPGRADVTEDDDEDPVTIPDLWGLRVQPWLTQAGTIRRKQNYARHPWKRAWLLRLNASPAYRRLATLHPVLFALHDRLRILLERSRK